MKAILQIVLFCVLPILGGAQIDTVDFDLKQSSLSKRKCNALILEKWHGSISYSPSKFTYQDSLVFNNSDTIYIRVYDGDRIRFECLKLPEWHPIGWVKYYSKNGELSKEEFWDMELSATDGYTTIYEGGDSGEISIEILYKNGALRKKIERKMNYDETIGFSYSYSIYKYGYGKVNKIKSKTNIYNRN